jgi:hypothetical protein
MLEDMWGGKKFIHKSYSLEGSDNAKTVKGLKDEFVSVQGMKA